MTAKTIYICDICKSQTVAPLGTITCGRLHLDIYLTPHSKISGHICKSCNDKLVETIDSIQAGK